MIGELLPKEKIIVKYQAYPRANTIQTDNMYRIFKCTPVNKDNTKIVLDRNGYFSIAGEYPYIDVNNTYEVKLKLEKSDVQWGNTYSVSEVINFGDFKNLTREESEEILQNIASPANIKTLLDNYPDFIEEMITYGKEYFDLSKLYGVKEAKIASYERNLLEKYKYYGVFQDNKHYGITMGDCKELVSEYKTQEKIKEEINKNPYHVLIDVLKKPFLYKASNGYYKGVDMLLCGEKGVRLDLKESELRTAYLMLYVLDLNENGSSENLEGLNGGSTKLLGNTLAKYCNNYAPELTKNIKKVAIESDLIYYDDETKHLAKMSTYIKEFEINKFIKELVDNNKELDIDFKKYRFAKDGELTDEQLEVLECFTKNRIMALDARAGTGKTFTMQCLLNMLDDNNLSYTCVSPTGLASKVFKNSTGRDCRTIHRTFLRDGGTFADVIVCDEWSMIGVHLAEMLIKCIQKRDTVRIVFLGNYEQLEPIEPLSLAYELLKCPKIPRVTLTNVFRYKEGGASKVSSDTINGKFYIENKDINKDSFSYGTKSDYMFFHCDNTTEQIVDIYKNILKENSLTPRDIAVLTPYNINDLGALKINNAIQGFVNPPIKNEKTMLIKRFGSEICLRLNSLVLNTKNNYSCMTEDVFEQLKLDENLIKDDFQKELVEIVNGDIGTVVEILDEFIKIQFDETIVVLTRKEAQDLLLAYSLNYYKCQGSSFRYVINIIAKEHRKNITRHGLYVAQTRQREKLIEVGDVETIRKAISTSEAHKRISNLTDMLRGW